MRLRAKLSIAGLLLAALVAIGSYSIADTALYPPSATRVAVTANAIEAFDNREPSRTRFGALEFRGGLQLTSRTRYFGGISGLHVEPDGSRFVAVTDRGSWLRGRILYENGRPVGVADAEMAPLLGWDGKALAARGWFDAEDPKKNFSIYARNIREVFNTCLLRPAENLCLEFGFVTHTGEEYRFRDPGWKNGDNKLVTDVTNYFRQAFPLLFFSQRTVSEM